MHEQLRVGAFVIILIGAVLTLVSIFADQLALGVSGSGFGWKQMTGTLIGLVIVVIGVLLWRRMAGPQNSGTRE